MAQEQQKQINLINHQPDIHIIYLYGKAPYEPKYTFLIYRRKTTGLKHYNGYKAFIEYSNNMSNIYDSWYA